MACFLPEGVLTEKEGHRMLFREPGFLKECIESGRILEGIAVCCDNEHNLIVDLGCMKGVIPREEGAVGISDGTVRDIAMISRVNMPVCFKIMAFSDKNGKTTAILSRRLAQAECQKEYVSQLRVGDIIPARVTHLESFGCFADIGCGISSLIPIDAASVSRITHPRDRFFVGQNIYTIVKGIDDQGRITLSHKELLGDWMQNASLFSAGETVAGVVRSIEEYGVFVELTPNLAGLAERKEGVKVGQQASVYIKSIIPEKMKIKLVIVDAFDADYHPADYRYYQTNGHMDCFCYSPPQSGRVVETVFEK